MDNNGTSWMYSNGSITNSTHWNINTEAYPIYVFTPAGVFTKRLLCIFLSIIGGVGFLGNCFIFFFLWLKPTRNLIQLSRFMKNYKFYVKCLSLSDLLSCGVSLPLICVQISFDVFQSGWSCKIVRYLQFIFPIITMNSLVVISLEKYFSTRTVPRTFSFSTVRRMVICAWVSGFVVMLVPSAAFDGIRVDLSNSHFTVICKNDETFYPFKMTLVLFPLQIVLPNLFVIYVNTCLVKSVWGRGNNRIANRVNNAFKAHLRAKKIKGTTLLVALTFAFVIPNLLFTGNVAYTQLAKPRRDFSTNYLMRYGTGGIVYVSSLLNFIIYFVQMKDFRVFLKKLLSTRNNKNNHPEVATKKIIAARMAMDKQNVPGMEDNAIELRQLETINAK